MSAPTSPAPSLKRAQSSDPLSFAELRPTNVSRCVNGFGHALDSWSPAEWTNAMCGEAGEAANIAKKMLRHRDNVAGNKGEDKDLALLREKLGRELADVVIYADLCAASQGIDLGAMVRETFNRKSDEIGATERLSLAPPQAEVEERDTHDEEELALIDAAFTLAMDGLECDSDVEFRARAFERIQDLYEPDRLMGQYRNRVDPLPPAPPPLAEEGDPTDPCTNGDHWWDEDNRCTACGIMNGDAMVSEPAAPPVEPPLISDHWYVGGGGFGGCTFLYQKQIRGLFTGNDHNSRRCAAPRSRHRSAQGDVEKAQIPAAQERARIVAELRHRSAMKLPGEHDVVRSLALESMADHIERGLHWEPDTARSAQGGER